MAKRASLGSYAPPLADGAHVEPVQAAPSAVAPQAEPQKKRVKPTTVYLPPDVVRTIKLLSIDGEGTFSDICSRAIIEHLRQRGLIRNEMLNV